ncbi:MAG TPA: YHS domain-containing protein [Planctomycetota bacterium]|nr:YHS domain-containing protein [Planctomycetota bacterium]
MATKIRGKKDAGQAVKDPVCGAQVDVQTSVTELEGGKQYYFCSDECRQKFIENPSDYTAA